MNNRFKGVFKDTPTYIDVSTGYFQEIKGTIYYTEAFVNCLKQENQQLKKVIKYTGKEHAELIDKAVKLQSTLEEIREYINTNCDFNGTALYDKWVAGKAILQIIDKGKCENEVSDTQEKCDKGE